MLLVEMPLVVGGWLRHFLPFLVITLLIRIARPEPAMDATWKVIGGLVLYPLCWLLEALVAWHLGGPWLNPDEVDPAATGAGAAAPAVARPSVLAAQGGQS